MAPVAKKLTLTWSSRLKLAAVRHESKVEQMALLTTAAQISAVYAVPAVISSEVQEDIQHSYMVSTSRREGGILTHADGAREGRGGTEAGIVGDGLAPCAVSRHHTVSVSLVSFVARIGPTR